MRTRTSGPHRAAARRHARSGRRRITAPVGLLTVAVTAGVLVWTMGRPPSRPTPPPGLSPSSTVGEFMSRYVTPGGRVERTDQGRDTVSEGQAYALLMAAATGDRRRFASIWAWTERHLVQPDGLLAWHWKAGVVVGLQPASDADLGTAAALVMASRRFGDPGLITAARRLAAAVLARETVTTGGPRTLVAGPWAIDPTAYVDPSYLAPAEMDTLAGAFGGPWRSLADAAGTQLEALTAGGQLPPDWAVIGSDGRIHPSGPPGSPRRPAVFGYDAVRAPIWMAVSCDAGLRVAAARLLPALRRGAGRVDLGLGARTAPGRPAPGSRAPVGLLAVAAAEWAGGHQRQAWADVERAARANRTHPTYYGTAWLALTTLAFDHTLESCPG